MFASKIGNNVRAHFSKIKSTIENNRFINMQDPYNRGTLFGALGGAAATAIVMDFKHSHEQDAYETISNAKLQILEEISEINDNRVNALEKKVNDKIEKLEVETIEQKNTLNAIKMNSDKYHLVIPATHAVLTSYDNGEPTIIIYNKDKNI